MCPLHREMKHKAPNHVLVVRFIRTVTSFCLWCVYCLVLTPISLGRYLTLYCCTVVFSTQYPQAGLDMLLSIHYKLLENTTLWKHISTK